MRFAHLADIHLGFQKSESLQKIEQDVFERSLDKCISLKVDFILIAGDLFHVNIPEMRVQKFAFGKFRQVHDAGIPVYVVYGSHDFSPVSNSVIDLLEEIGYIIKVTRVRESADETITLDFVTDKKTGAKIAGFSGLKAGKDVEYYEKLDRKSLESEQGFKIFLFHGGIAEMKIGEGSEGDYMPLSLLPRGFDYYAGGHLHRFSHQQYEDHSHVVYPGTPFAGYYSDLEDNARGQVRGFVLAEFGDAVKKVELVRIPNTSYEMIEVNADNRMAESINDELREKTQKTNPKGKIVLVRIRGELTSGKTTDVDLVRVRDELVDKGALIVNLSRNQFSSREYRITEASGDNKKEIEENVFSENIGEVKLDQKELVGGRGMSLAKALLREIGNPPLANEKKDAYQKRIQQGALMTMGLDADDS